jgi:hypothetical protein
MLKQSRERGVERGGERERGVEGEGERERESSQRESSSISNLFFELSPTSRLPIQTSGKTDSWQFRGQFHIVLVLGKLKLNSSPCKSERQSPMNKTHFKIYF